MKKLEALIQPHQLDDINRALIGIGVDEVMISEVRGNRRKNAPSVTFRGSEYNAYSCSVKIEMIVPNYRVEQIIGVLSDAAATGESGAGKIFISSIDEAVRICNGDRGDDAL